MGSIVYKIDNLGHLDPTGSQTIAVPEKYGALVIAARDELVIYYAARVTHNGGEYRAFARVGNVLPHPTVSACLQAEVSNYTLFPVAVPAYGTGRNYERSLSDRNWRSMVMRGVRALPDDEAAAIIEAGSGDPQEEADDRFLEDQRGFAEQDQPAFQEQRRERETFDRLRRWFANRRECRRRYRCGCSFTGSSLQDREGNPAGECCHVFPLRDGGPDVIENMIFLSRDMHWAYDRHLISLNDDFSFRPSRFLEPKLQQMLHADGYARVPQNPGLRPSIEFIRRHRKDFLRLEK